MPWRLIESSLVTWPMLRLDPEFMVSVIAVYANLGDPRAAILAEQMLEAEMNDGQRRILIMTQVKDQAQRRRPPRRRPRSTRSSRNSPRRVKKRLRRVN